VVGPHERTSRARLYRRFAEKSQFGSVREIVAARSTCSDRSCFNFTGSHVVIKFGRGCLAVLTMFSVFLSLARRKAGAELLTYLLGGRFGTVIPFNPELGGDCLCHRPVGRSFERLPRRPSRR